MRSAVALLFLSALAGCGGAPPIDADAGCGEPGVAADQPVIGCPEEVDLGCVGAAGATLSYSVSTATCDGSDVTLSCTPATGSVVPASGGGFASCTATAASGASARCTFPIRMQVAGPPQLVCAPDVTVACSGPRSAVSLAAPVPLESCDGTGTLGAASSDAPAEGFAVGSSLVTFTATSSAGAPVTCTSAVVVTDTEAPSITCPVGPQTVIRTAPSDVILNFAPPSSDACDDRLTITVAPPPVGRGDTAVVATATDDAGNAASCDATIRVLDVFAAEDLRVMSAEPTASGTTVTLAWEPSLGLDVEELALERAEAMAGPFTELTRLAPGTLTYTDEDAPGDEVFYRLVSYGPSTTRGGITEVVRAMAVMARSYEMDGVPVPGVPFATTLYGVVRHPRVLADGAYPLVVFLHGNHGNCRPASGDDECQERVEHRCTEPGFTTTPNAEGYVYAMETLAAQGHIAVSLSANALNCRDDFIEERTALILEHLRRWVAGTLELPEDVLTAADLSRVALIGHSRGGEAVSQVPQALEATPIAGLSLASVLALGPTDYHDNTPTGVPYLVVLPGCDADVRDLQGVRMVDRGAAARDGEIHGHVLFVGANHNFFNTEWRYDDNGFGVPACASGDRLDGPAIRAGFEDLVSTWVRATVDGAEVPAYFRAEERSPVSLDAWADRGLDLRFAYFSPSRTVIDDFTGALETGLLGPVTYTGFTAAVACTGTCAGSFPHVASGGRLAWDEGAALATFDAGGADARSATALSIRFASRAATINDGIEEHDFAIRLVDARGTTVAIPVSEVGRVPAVYSGTRPLEVLGTVRLPLSRVRALAPSFDLASLAEVAIEMPLAGSERGSLWIADVELSGP